MESNFIRICRIMVISCSHFFHNA